MGGRHNMITILMPFVVWGFSMAETQEMTSPRSKAMRLRNLIKVELKPEDLFRDEIADESMERALAEVEFFTEIMRQGSMSMQDASRTADFDELVSSPAIDVEGVDTRSEATGEGNGEFGVENHGWSDSKPGSDWNNVDGWSSNGAGTTAALEASRQQFFG